MKMTYVLVGLLAMGLFWSAHGCCSPTPISGKILSDCDSKPLENVKVKLESDTSTTNKYGWFFLTAHGNGYKWITATLEGYKKYRTKIDVKCGLPVFMYIRMEPNYGCEPEYWCGDEICDETENCSTCPQDCGECEEPEPEPKPKTTKKSTHGHCDHCFFVGGLARYYQNLQFGWWYKYAEDCGIEYDRKIPPQNLRHLCNLKEAMK